MSIKCLLSLCLSRSGGKMGPEEDSVPLAGGEMMRSRTIIRSDTGEKEKKIME